MLFNKTFVRSLACSTLSSVMLLGALVVVPSVGYSESFPGCDGEPPKPRRLPALGQGLFKKLAPVDEMISPFQTLR